MKKKCVYLILVSVMMTVLAGCGGAAGKSEIAVASSVELLNSVWEKFEEGEKFPAMGGSFDAPVDNAAGAFNIEDTENLSYMLYVPADQASNIDEAASLMHAMNANTFTGAAFHLADGADAKAFLAALEENILNTQWMCGIPDEMAIYTINDVYVISVFGNEDIMDEFEENLVEIYGSGAVLYVEKDIA